eukprot:TRINITY_DN2703_c0_g1_i2.p1 TRINITY_DN2703_c0_g1~~TRINITY_DN2703_c0_g1_i2.p1  ORF type:complete len:299 (+),score=44.72 TRINITY_DN2703_c0_g1_i2:33-929(+)
MLDWEDLISEEPPSALKGLGISLEGFPISHTNDFKTFLLENEARVASFVNNKTQYMVSTHQKILENGAKIRRAINLNIPVVDENFLYHSLIRKKLQKVRDYSPLEKQQTNLDDIYALPALEQYFKDFCNAKDLDFFLKPYCFVVELCKIDGNHKKIFLSNEKIPRIVKDLHQVEAGSNKREKLSRILNFWLDGDSNLLRLHTLELVAHLLELKYIHIAHILKDSGIVDRLFNIFFEDFSSSTIYMLVVTRWFAYIFQNHWLLEYQEYLLIEKSILEKYIRALDNIHLRAHVLIIVKMP